MPFDAVLMASRIVVAAEAATALNIERLIAACPGAENERHWEKCYGGETGGIVTMHSEFGEPSPKVANRGMRLSHQFDETFFSKSLPAKSKKRAAKIAANRDCIIRWINEDFQKR